MEEVAIQASAIRNAFFDNRKQMEDVIPPVLLVAMDDRIEISPRKTERITVTIPMKKEKQEEVKKATDQNNKSVKAKRKAA